MIYAAGLTVTSPLWAWRMYSTGKRRTDWRGRFGHAPALTRDSRQTILLHAVSVGEANALRGLIDELHRQAGDRIRLVISTTTDTGFARATEIYGNDHAVVRYPLDFTWMVDRFLDAVQPDLVVLAELEVWPNFMQACDRRGIAVGVVNGRLSARSFARYHKVRGLMRPMFDRLAFAAVQTDDYAQRFKTMGTRAGRVQVIHSMKWDNLPVRDDVPGSDALATAMGIDRTRPIIVAGSTGPGEERLLIDTCPADAQLVLVPRKPERFDEVAAMDAGMQRRSGCPDGSATAVDAKRRLFLVDTMGELMKAYALADVALVGRSFLGLFGSNPLEPVTLGKATVIGTHHSDFQDMVDALKADDGIRVNDAPGQVAAALLKDAAARRALAENGRRVILSRQGSTKRHAALVLEHLPKRD